MVVVENATIDKTMKLTISNKAVDSCGCVCVLCICLYLGGVVWLITAFITTYTVEVKDVEFELNNTLVWYDEFKTPIAHSIYFFISITILLCIWCFCYNLAMTYSVRHLPGPIAVKL